MESNLLPCPFCGGKAVIAKIAYGELYNYYSVTCSNWRCTVATVVPNFSDKEEAIEAWNRRPSEVVKVETNFYDHEEIYPDCTVQVLTNTATGDVSVGWWKNE